MARGGHGIPRSSLVPVKPYPSMPRLRYSVLTCEAGLELWQDWDDEFGCHRMEFVEEIIEAGKNQARLLRGLVQIAHTGGEQNVGFVEP
jgi:hypothetical protein